MELCRLLPCFILLSSISSTLGVFFEYGPFFGDSVFPIVDDGFQEIHLTSNYRYYGINYDKLFLGSNGYITFAGGDSSFEPLRLCLSTFPMIAPMWSDVYLPDSSGDLFYRETADAGTLKQIGDIIDNNMEGSCKCSFTPRRAFIATWNSVPSFCNNDYYYYYYYYYYYNYYENYYDNDASDRTTGVNASRNATDRKADMIARRQENQTEDNEAAADAAGRTHNSFSTTYNTFQVAFVTNDARKSFVIFNYRDIDWTNCFGYNRVGFSPGSDNEKVNKRCYELPYSGSSDLNNLKYESNVGIPGTWVYAVNAEQIKDEDCDKVGNCC